jgi:hypothetical protein
VDHGHRRRPRHTALQQVRQRHQGQRQGSIGRGGAKPRQLGFGHACVQGTGGSDQVGLTGTRAQYRAGTAKPRRQLADGVLDALPASRLAPSSARCTSGSAASAASNGTKNRDLRFCRRSIDRHGFTRMRKSQARKRSRSWYRGSAWYAKELPTFADTLALVRQQLWPLRIIRTSHEEADVVLIPRALLHRTTETLAYAA